MVLAPQVPTNANNAPAKESVTRLAATDDSLFADATTGITGGIMDEETKAKYDEKADLAVWGCLGVGSCCVRFLCRAVRWSGQLMQASACGDVQTCRYAVQLLCKLSDAADAADVDVDTEC